MKTTNKIALYLLLTISLLSFLFFLVLVTIRVKGLVFLDNDILTTVANSRTRFFDYVFVIISYLGETKTIIVLCLILLLLPNRKKFGIPVTVAVVVSGLINYAIKYLVLRARPENLFLFDNTLNYQMPTSPSFPSGHSQTALVFYFSSFYLLLKNKSFFDSKAKRIILSIIVVEFSLLMCFARIYLGVHFLSDVLAGLCLMIAIMSLFVLINQSLHFDTEYL